MSGAYRTQVGQIKSRLNKYLADVDKENFTDFSAFTTPEQKKEAIYKAIHTCTQYHLKIRTAVNGLTAINDKWITLLVNMTNETNRTAEELMYNKSAEELNKLIEEGTVMMDTLEAQRDGMQSALINMGSFTGQYGAVSPNDNTASPTVPLSNVRLPELEMVHFYGDTTQWKPFWDAFEASIHKNPRLTNVQKFAYLVPLVHGKAKDAIDGYAVTADNYSIVIKILQDYFGNAEKQREVLHRELKKLKPIKGGSSDELRSLMSKIERILRQLEAMSEDTEHPQIEIAIREKLPTWLLKKLGETKAKESTWSVKKMRTAIEETLRINEHAEEYAKGSGDYHDKKPNDHKQKQQYTKQEERTTSTFAVTGKPQYGKNSKHSPDSGTKKQSDPTKEKCVCNFCDGNHPSEHCRKYPDEDSRWNWAKERKACFKCAKIGHRSGQCKAKLTCKKCGKRHETSICQQGRHARNAGRKTIASVAAVEHSEHREIQVASVVSINFAKRRSPETILQSREVCVQNPDDPTMEAITMLMMDNGAMMTFITLRLARRLRLKKIGEEVLSVETFAANGPTKVLSPYYELNIKLKDGQMMKIIVHALKKLTGQIKTMKLPNGEKEIQMLDSSMIHKKMEYVEPEILIGMDNFVRIMGEDIKIRYVGGYQYADSRIGYMLMGEIPNQDGTKPMYATISKPTEVANSKDLDEMVRDWLHLEQIGIVDKPNENDDDIAVIKFNESISKLEDGRYEVGLPWKENLEIHENRDLAFARLKSMVHKYRRENPEVLVRYDEILKEQISLGITEIVDESKEPDGPVIYMPHRPVVTPQKNTTKIRPVCDASAKKTKWDKSFNDNLYKGPVMLNDMTGVMIRARTFKILIVADIEKAFHMISLRKKDRDATRFLWIKDVNGPISRENLLVIRFCMVVFGLICSPFLMNATIKHHLQQELNKLAALIIRNIYADNVMMPANSTAEAEDTYRYCLEVFKKAQMRLREFACNDAMVKIDPEDRIKGNDETIKLLGLVWNLGKDTLGITFPNAMFRSPRGKITKRTILQTIASPFDPLGLISPVLLHGKIFIQHLWEKKHPWDKELDKMDEQKWLKIEEALANRTITVQRRVTMDGGEDLELHAFCDASGAAYATCVYLRSRVGEKYYAHLIFSKLRVKPKDFDKKKKMNEKEYKQDVTIPKMELLGATIGVKALKFMEEQLDLPIQRRFLHTDSKCVMAWIQNVDDIQPVFVDNQLRKIRRGTMDEILHVGTKENPADLPTRGCTVEELEKNEQWWFGPDFLKTHRKNWKTQPDKQLIREQWTPKIEDFIPESEPFMAHVKVKPQNSVIKMEEYSSWESVVRTMVFVLRYIKIMVLEKAILKSGKKIQNWFSHTDLKLAGYITGKEQRIGEKYIIRQIQKSSPPIPDEVKALDIREDEEGILRCYGRLLRSNLPAETKTPIWLPRKHHATELLIASIHRQNLHTGIRQTLSDVRRKFWISKGRSTVQRAIKKNCMICRRFNAKPFPLPKMAPIPESRIKQNSPFANTGVDYFGPIKVKDGDNSTKVWVSLFTCMVTRAIHMEVVRDQSAISFIAAFRRFISRRTRPDLIVSDNATTFHLAAKALDVVWKEVMENPQANIYFSNKGITWSFIPEKGPWFGGFYERLIGLVKNSLRRTIGKKQLSIDEFSTLITEVESVVNCRPLTFVYEDFHSPEVIRPVDFLLAKSLPGQPQITEENPNEPEYIPGPIDRRDIVIDAWNKMLKLLNEFWRIWHYDYLASLRERNRLSHPSPRSEAQRSPQLDEIVLLEEEDTPRGLWKLAKIVELVPSKDNEIRVAKIKMGNGHIFTRPINQLYPLELMPDIKRQEKQTLKDKAKEEPQELKKYELRPRKVKLFPLLVLIAIICPGQVICIRCPSENYYMVMDHPSCVQSGIIVKQTPAGFLCWDAGICQNGHLRRKPETKYIYSESDMCGDKCQCAEWAENCSFYNGTNTAISTIQNEKVAEALRQRLPDVCSFEQVPNCNPKATTLKMMQIELFDGTKHLIKDSAKIAIKDALAEDYECVGEESGTVTGSPHFCIGHRCEEMGTRFCYYRQPPIALLDTSELSIPIANWGFVEAKFYGPLEVKESTCQHCYAECTQGGINLQLEENLGMIEACSHHVCLKMPQPKANETIPFPPDIVLSPYEASVQVWKRGTMIRELHIECPAYPFCENLKEIFSWKIVKFNCMPKFITIMAAIITLVIALIVYMVLKIVLTCVLMCSTGFRMGANLAQICMGCLTTICPRSRRYTIIDPNEDIEVPRTTKVYTIQEKKKKPKSIKINVDSISNVFDPECPLLTPRTPTPTSINSGRTTPKFSMPSLSKTIVTLMIIGVCIAQAHGCAYSDSFSAREDRCTINANGVTECTFDESTVLNLLAKGQQTCLMLQDSSQRPAGHIELVTHEVEMECSPKTMFYTRSFELNAYSIERCPSAGSCYENRCASVTSNSTISEFGYDINQKPGHTFCKDSEGCWFNGCFLCTPACMFYKIYPTSKSGKIYELFKCQDWQLSIRINASLTTNNGVEKTQLQLLPGIPSTWKNLKFALDAVTIPPSSNFAATFITDGKRTAIVPDSIEPILHDFRCQDMLKAVKLDCTFNPNLCTCVNVDHREACRCPSRDLEEIVMNEPNLLPAAVVGNDNQFIHVDGKRVWAPIANAVAQIKTSINGLRLITQSEMNSCKVTVKKIEGCSRCKKGAVATITCSTDFGNAMVHVQCDSISFGTMCEKEPTEKKISLHFDIAVVNEKCLARCPASTQELQLKANLHVVPETVADSTIEEHISAAQPSEGISILSIAKLIINENLLLYSFVIGILLIVIYISMYCFCLVRR